jgi:hypothetical protein
MDSGDQVAASRLVSFLPTLLEWPDHYRIIRIIDAGHARFDRGFDMSLDRARAGSFRSITPSREPISEEYRAA